MSVAFKPKKSLDNTIITPYLKNNPTSDSITDKTTTDSDTENTPETDTKKQITPTKLSESNPSSKSFDWAILNSANLFKSSVNAKSALPKTSRASRSTQARSVVNNTNRNTSRNTSQNSRQSTTTPKPPRPTSGKNTGRNMSNSVSRRIK